MDLEFYKEKQELTQLMLDTVKTYLRSRGVEIHSEGLRQMSHSLPDMAGEILMFGANCWPEGCEEEQEASATILPFRKREPNTQAPSRLLRWYKIRSVSEVVAYAGTLGMTALQLVVESPMEVLVT